jgi:hypothetical protein
MSIDYSHSDRYEPLFPSVDFLLIFWIIILVFYASCGCVCVCVRCQERGK